MLLYDQQTRLRIEEAARTIGVSMDFAAYAVERRLVRYTRSGRLFFVNPGDLLRAFTEYKQAAHTAERR